MASSSMAQQAVERAAMPPPPPRTKRKQVLEEEVYAGAIEAIVERDFFPHLPKLQNQLEWLQAVQSGDPSLIKQAQLNIARRRAGLRTPLAHEGSAGGATTGPLATPGTALLRTPAMTPAPAGPAAAAAAAAAGGGGATPALAGLRTPAGPAAALALQEAEGLDPVAAQQAVGARAPALGLDAFFGSYQGEDNASFQQLHETTLARKRAKMAHHLEDKNKPLLLEAGGHATDESGTSGQAPSTLRFTRHEPKSALYYDASQRPQLALTVAERATIVAGPPKSISHRATRSLQEEAEGQGDGGSDGVAGGGIGGGAQQQRGGGGGLGTRGYGYMRTPQIVPGVGASPLMTWGDIASTPLRLEGDAGGASLAGQYLDLGLDEYDEEAAAAAAMGKQFTLPEVRSREARAQAMMAARAARTRRQATGARPSGGGLGGAAGGSGAGTPLLNSLRRGTTPGRAGGSTGAGGSTPHLSAAGLKLAQQLRRPGTGERGGGSSALPGDLPGLRASYTQRGGAPTPSRTPTPLGTAARSWDATTPSRALGGGGSGGGARPVGSTAAAGVAGAASKPTSITDNLLKLK